jgi:multisubunit Na+/H+ antiporter MnhE subunit
MEIGEGRRRLFAWCLRWLLLALLWLALTDSRALPELIAAAVAGALGATLASLIVRPGPPRTLRMTARLASIGPRRLGRPLARLLLDNGVLGKALWRRLVERQPVEGTLRSAHLSSEAALRSAAGRVATEAWGSLTPNRYVIGVDEEAGTILVHELMPSREPVEPLARR